MGDRNRERVSGVQSGSEGAPCAGYLAASRTQRPKGIPQSRLPRVPWDFGGESADTQDNALTECVIGLYTTECIGTTVFHADPYRTISDLEYATAG